MWSSAESFLLMSTSTLRKLFLKFHTGLFISVRDKQSLFAKDKLFDLIPTLLRLRVAHQFQKLYLLGFTFLIGCHCAEHFQWRLSDLNLWWWLFLSLTRSLLLLTRSLLLLTRSLSGTLLGLLLWRRFSI